VDRSTGYRWCTADPPQVVCRRDPKHDSRFQVDVTKDPQQADYERLRCQKIATEVELKRMRTEAYQAELENEIRERVMDDVIVALGVLRRCIRALPADMQAELVEAMDDALKEL